MKDMKLILRFLMVSSQDWHGTGRAVITKDLEEIVSFPSAQNLCISGKNIILKEQFKVHKTFRKENRLS